MATLTLNYDDKNALVKSLLHAAILAGATEVATKKMSPLDKALEDVRRGKVTTVCKPKHAPQNKQ